VTPAKLSSAVWELGTSSIDTTRNDRTIPTAVTVAQLVLQLREDESDLITAMWNSWMTYSGRGGKRNVFTDEKLMEVKK